MSTNAEKPLKTKKPYESPKLRVYGDIGTLTGATGTMSNTGDGGMGTANKT